MANAIKGELAVTIDGDELTLCLDVNALCEVEALFGKTSADMIPKIDSGDMILLRGFFWAACRRNHSDVNLVEAGDYVFALHPPEASRVLIECLRLSFPAIGAGATGETARPRKAAKAAKPAATDRGISSAS